MGFAKGEGLGLELGQVLHKLWILFTQYIYMLEILKPPTYVCITH